MRLLLLTLLAAIPAAAQSGTGLTFDAISIKPHSGDNNTRVLPHFLPGGRFTSMGMPLRFVISLAYDVGFQSPRLSGGPDWLKGADGSSYDIEATPPPGAFPPGLAGSVRRERERQMLQALLAERFHVQVRRENKELSAYVLTVGKNGLKLTPAKIQEKDCAPEENPAAACHQIMGGRGRGLHGEAVSVGDIATYVENWTDRPLVDETGIKGLYNVQTSGWIDVRPGPEPAPGAKGEDGSLLVDTPSLPAVLESLGLKMTPRKVAVEVFVIEHAEKPTAN